MNYYNRGTKLLSLAKVNKTRHGITTGRFRFESTVGRSIQSKTEEDEFLNYYALNEVLDKVNGTIVYKETESSERPKPWHSLLYSPAKLDARGAFPPPQLLVEAQQAIFQSNRIRGKQLQGTFEKMVAVHSKLAQVRSLKRLLKEKKYSPPKPGSIAAQKWQKQQTDSLPLRYGPQETLAFLHHRLLPNFAIIRRILLETQGLLGEGNFRPARVLDYGIGCGSASAAALGVIGPDVVAWIHGIDTSRSQREVAKSILEYIVENNKQQVSPSKSTANSSITRVTLSDSLTTSTHKSSQSESNIEGTFDLVLCCHTLLELPHSAASLSAAAILWEKLSDGGVMVVVEPGTPDGFDTVRAIRSMLLECCPIGEREECHVLAPCTHNGLCPMDSLGSQLRAKDADLETIGPDFDPEQHPDWAEEDFGSEGQDLTDDEEDDEDLYTSELDTTIDGTSQQSNEEFPKYFQRIQQSDSSFCSFVQQIHSSNRRSEKFSYLVVQKRRPGSFSESQENIFRNDNVADLLAKSISKATSNGPDESLLQEAISLANRHGESNSENSDLELAQAPHLSSWGRIIRAPLKKRGHIYLDFCSARGLGSGDGQIIQHCVTKGIAVNAAPGLYHAARKARWGGLWPDISERLTK